MKARKALSRILVEILLVVIVLAALAGAYFVYSMYAGSATTQLSAIVQDAYASGTQLVVNIKNTGAVKITSASAALADGTSLTLSSPSSVQLTPGQSISLTFTKTGGFSAGEQYTIILTIGTDTQSQQLVFKVTAI
ncbi:MAG: hypothetical protein QXI42_11860 [Thermoproteota archaeon]